MFSVLCESWQPTPVLLPGESPWSEEPGELQAMGLKRVGHDSATKHSTVRISLKMDIQGIPWWSSGEDSTLSLPRAGVQSLVRELKAQVTRGGQKKRKKVELIKTKKRMVFARGWGIYISNV